MGLFEVSILILIYYIGNKAPYSDINRISMMKAIYQPDFLATSIEFVAFFSGILYFVTYKYYKKCGKEELDPESIELYTIKLKGLHRNIPAS